MLLPNLLNEDLFTEVYDFVISELDKEFEMFKASKVFVEMEEEREFQGDMYQIQDEASLVNGL